MCEICRCHPDLLVVDLGTNDLAGTDCTVPDVVNRVLRFLALVDNEVHPKQNDPRSVGRTQNLYGQSV